MCTCTRAGESERVRIYAFGGPPREAARAGGARDERAHMYTCTYMKGTHTHTHTHTHEYRCTHVYMYLHEERTCQCVHVYKLRSAHETAIDGRMAGLYRAAAAGAAGPIQYTCVHVYMHTCVHAYMRTSVHVCMCTCVQACTLRVCTYVHAYFSCAYMVCMRTYRVCACVYAYSPHVYAHSPGAAAAAGPLQERVRGGRRR
jgi:hypothetical protein